MMMHDSEGASSESEGVKRNMIGECSLVMSRKSEVSEDSRN